MAKQNLYSAAMNVGKTGAAYSSSVLEASTVQDELSFLKRQSDYDIEKTGKMVELLSTGLELGSTLYGGQKDKAKFKERTKALEGKYGKMTENKSSFRDKLFGIDSSYTFGEGEDSKTFSKAAVSTQGGMLLGETNLNLSEDPSGISLFEEVNSSNFDRNFLEDAQSTISSFGSNMSKIFSKFKNEEDSNLSWTSPEDKS